MNDDYMRRTQAIPAGRADMAVDAGLRAFMLGVFNKMALGLLLSGLLAWTVGNVEPVYQVVFGTPLRWVVMFAPLAILLIAPFAMRNPSPTASGLLYWAIVALLGIGLGSIFVIYTGASIAQTFFATAAGFGALSLWGYTTKKDLTGFGSFLIMGLFGLIIASIIGIFVHSTALHMAISVIGVLIFAGLTAYDTQRLKHSYYQLSGDGRGLAVATNFGALSLYLDFVNLFMFLLNFLGNRR
jgi:uncharacterized protein